MGGITSTERPDKLAKERIYELGNFLSAPGRPHDLRIAD